MATIDNVKRDYLAINRVAISDAQAAVIAAQIDAGTTTEAAFVSQQIAGAKFTTQPEVATFALITGVTQSSAQLDSEVAFAKAQTAAYAAAGYNANLAPFETLGAAIATGADTKAAFATKFGALSNTEFVATIYTQVTGNTPVFTGNPLGGETTAGDHFLAQIAFYTKFAQTNLPGVDAAAYARGAIAGQIASLAFTDPATIASSTLDDQTVSYLTTLASGSTDGYGKALPTVGTAGSTIVLTTNIDAPGAVAPAANTTGTNGNDTFLGADGTLQTGDVLDGKGGNDILKFTSTVNSAAPILASISNIETYSVTQATAGNLAELSLLNSSGYKTLETSGGSGGVKFSSVGTIANAHAVNTTSGSLNIAYAAATVAGTADVQNLALDNALENAGATAAFTVNGIETIAITSTGKNTLTGAGGVGISDAALTKVTSAGAGSLSINGFDSTVLTSYDASTATGVQKVTFNTVSDVAVKGGTANDVFTFGTTFTSKDTVDGGTGSDTVSVAGGADISAPTNDTLKGLNALVAVETVAFTANAALTTIDQATLTNTAITKLVFNTTGNGDEFVNNAVSTVTYAFGAGHDESQDSHIFVKAGNTVLNLALEGAAKTATTAFDDANTDFLDVTGALTVNLKSNGANDPSLTFKTANPLTDFNNIGDGGGHVIFNTAGATFNVSGDANTSIFGFQNSANVDASGLSGLFKVGGSVFADSYHGGTNQNDITGDGGIDTIDISASATKVDTIHLNGIVAQANRDGVTGFTTGTGGDIIGINAADTTAPTAGGPTPAPVLIQPGVIGATNWLTATNDVLAYQAPLAGAGLAGATDGSALLAQTGPITLTAATKGYIVAYQAGNAFLYYAEDNTGGAGTLDATDIHLVGTLNGVAAGSVTAANFLLA